jgi:hypothetical protein
MEVLEVVTVAEGILGTLTLRARETRADTSTG